MRNLLTILFLFSCCALHAQRIFSKKENVWLYPQCHTVSAADKFHGIAVEDPYRWLENSESDTTKKWIKEQERFYANYFYKFETLSYQQLTNEVRELSLMKYWDAEIPVKRGKYFYEFDYEPGTTTKSLYVKDSLRGPKKLLINPGNITSKSPLSISSFAPSQNSELIAISLSAGGAERANQIRILKLPSGKKTGEMIQDAKPGSVRWHDDGFYYSRVSATNKKTEEIYYHSIGATVTEDELIFKGSENELLQCKMSRDHRFMVIEVSSSADCTSKVYYKDFNQPLGFRPLVAKFKNHLNFLDNNGDNLLFVTDFDAPNFRVVSIHPERPLEWELYFPEFPEHTLEDFVKLKDRILINQFGADGYHLGIFDTNFVRLHTLDATPGYTLDIQEIVGDTLYYSLHSFTYPPVFYTVNLQTFEIAKFDTTKIMYDPGDFVTTQMFYPSKDSTMIPIYVCHKKMYKPTGNDVTLLEVYGGYGYKKTDKYDPTLLYLLSKGGVYAFAEVRGGGYYGGKWHEAGELLNKQNAIDDVIAAGEFLINSGYTSPERLAITGGSHGGLLVGAAITQRPELFKVAITTVGLFDMLHYEKMRLGSWNVSEFGSVENPDEFKNLLSYSPLQKVKKGQRYPAMLAITSENDERVMPYQSYKFVAALQNANPGGNPVLLKVLRDAGHTGSKNFVDRLSLDFDIVMFLFCNTNYMNEFPKSTFYD